MALLLGVCVDKLDAFFKNLTVGIFPVTSGVHQHKDCKSFCRVNLVRQL